MKKFFTATLAALSIGFFSMPIASADFSDDASDFVLISEAVPDVIQEIRYYSTYNFVGERIDGYDQPCAMLTKEAALALKNASDFVMQYGYRLKIYDAYRPQRAVDHFVRWAQNLNDTRMKDYFYPLEDKSQLFAKGYIAEHSGHSRGSTVDLTLFDMRTGKEVDMGGTFDYFGELSHPDYVGDLTEQQIDNRNFLRHAMIRSGFKPLDEEWWHFTLKDEPYPDTYFTFTSNAVNDPKFAAQQLNDQYMQAALWMENAAEYRELCYQAYNIALERVDQAVKSKKKFKKPLAIVLDIDETVISTTDYTASFIGTDRSPSKAEEIAWIKETIAQPMPGAADFLNAVDKKGVEIFYVTNRRESDQYEITLEDLNEAGFPTVKPGHLLLRGDDRDKSARIANVEAKYEVIVYMGDNSNDLPIGTYDKLTNERNSIVDKNRKEFGVKFIALPNPVYGYWLRALADDYTSLTPQQKELVHQGALNRWK